MMDLSCSSTGWVRAAPRHLRLNPSLYAFAFLLLATTVGARHKPSTPRDEWLGEPAPPAAPVHTASRRRTTPRQPFFFSCAARRAHHLLNNRVCLLQDQQLLLAPARKPSSVPLPLRKPWHCTNPLCLHPRLCAAQAAQGKAWVDVTWRGAPPGIPSYIPKTFSMLPTGHGLAGIPATNTSVQHFFYTSDGGRWVRHVHRPSTVPPHSSLLPAAGQPSGRSPNAGTGTSRAPATCRLNSSSWWRPVQPWPPGRGPDRISWGFFGAPRCRCAHRRLLEPLPGSAGQRHLI